MSHVCQHSSHKIKLCQIIFLHSLIYLFIFILFIFVFFLFLFLGASLLQSLDQSKHCQRTWNAWSNSSPFQSSAFSPPLIAVAPNSNSSHFHQPLSRWHHSFLPGLWELEQLTRSNSHPSIIQLSYRMDPILLTRQQVHNISAFLENLPGVPKELMTLWSAITRNESQGTPLLL